MHDTVVVFPLPRLLVLPQGGGDRTVNLRSTVGVCDPKTTSPEVKMGFSTSVGAPTWKDFCCYRQKIRFRSTSVHNLRRRDVSKSMIES